MWWMIISAWQLVDPKTGEEKKVTISEDDGIRPGTTLADLAKLKAVFKKSGSTTAGVLRNKHECYIDLFALV
jgi:acetyl-CoA acetyltransferase